MIYPVWERTLSFTINNKIERIKEKEQRNSNLVTKEKKIQKNKQTVIANINR